MVDFGLDIAIPFTGDPDPSLPWADDDDALLVPGSLALFDATHSASPLSGVPEVGATIPNIAWKRARDLIGLGDATSLSFTRGGQADQAGVQVTERTGMGGLHSIQTQTNGVVGVGTAIIGKVALQNYVSANRSHAFYLSIWDRVTRVATTSIDPGEAEIGDNTSAYNIIVQPGAFAPITSTGLQLGAMSDPATRNTAGNRFSAVASSGYLGTFVTPSRVAVSGWGMWGAWASQSAFLNRAASRVLYRAYIEDLTVSGRTYAQVQALDYALWQAAFAPGGRYAGDTFTQPAI